MTKQRSLTDSEIALVKAMLRKGWRNDAIHYYFNRSDRLISSGRIAQIKAEKYGASVEEALPEELDAFLASWGDGSAERPPAPSPVDQRVLRAMFVRAGGGWKLIGGETDRAECKASFRLRPEDHFSKILRAVAGLANNRGGYILLGITDGSFQAEGLRDATFTNTDVGLINRALASSLDPVPHVTKASLDLGGRLVGVLYVEKHADAPVLAIKNVGQDIKEGGIYFRYVGETRLIKPGELRQIIAAREQRAIAEFGARVRRVASGKDATIDLDSGEVSGASGRFVIDKSLLASIQFVREGDFTQQKGSPALKLIGNVEPVSEAEKERTHVIRQHVTPDAVVRNFLLNEKIAEPLSYIHFQAFNQRRWMPIWFYINQTTQTASKIADDLRSSVATHPSSRDAVVRRIEGKDLAFRSASGKPGALAKQLIRGEISEPTTIEEDVVFAGAVQSLPDTVKKKDVETIRKILTACLDRAENDMKGSRRGMIYRAACRVDELLNAAKQIASESAATAGQTVAAKSSASTAMGEP
ncbi:RNA-binding domain-containing protein [Tardiphaga sp. 285_C5_N1_2]|uniref:AlbA family DNA-binding domain-containing protein n=1 Tax=Tardiphaga sp. 285_C5_N1_2 TaxID=3240775 RepID=UPI003F8B1D7F